ncbi:hypothetical protein B7463_g2600, partial [Scytalidium lignicola]
MAEPALDLASPWQLDIIDALRRLGIASFVGLPQLAVVGDQSSGKSSVLEGISHLPFPRDSGLCTRFATQIIFRRAPTTSTKVSIIPGPDRNPDEKIRLRNYVKEGLTTLTADTFLEILLEVCELMGIPGPGQSLEDNKSTFSEDLLSIELCGPNQQNLSIIDIPGIFRTPTEGVTTKGDIDLVRKIMLKYIKDERTIILAVIPSNIDIATQEIISIAKELDPQGVRTLGVLTKPDLIDKGGEENVMSLVEGKRNQLRLGYCIVRNRGQSELSTDHTARHKKEEAFFSVEPWSRLDADRVGIPALQKRLQSLLVSITRREFPKVQAEIMKQLSDRRRRLESLGVDRESTEQQRQFLLDMAQKFQDLTSCALDAYYYRHSIFEHIPELRLATLVVERNERFSKDIETLGHTYNFNSEVSKDEDTSSQALSTLSLNDSTEETQYENREYPELLDLITNYGETSKPIEQGIIEWIGEEYRKARGFGLAPFGPSIFPTIWQQQSKNWEGLTLAYIEDIVLFVHDFVYKALSHVCPDEGIRFSLWSVLQEQLVDSYRVAIRHVQFIIQVERFGTPLTMNSYFNDRLQKRRSLRSEKSEYVNNSNRGDEPNNFTRLSQLEKSTVMNNSEYTIEDFHDFLESYYEVARKRFIDTVCMQGSDFYLLTGLKSPLRIFGTAFVSRLSEDQLDLIAGEDVSTKQLRNSLKNEIAALEKGKKQLRV